MAEDSSARKIELVGQLRSEVDKLAQSFNAIDASSSSFARNVSYATGLVSGASGSNSPLGAANAMSGFSGPAANPSTAGYQSASAAMSLGIVPATATTPPGATAGTAGTASPFGNVTNTLSASGMGLASFLPDVLKPAASISLGIAGMVAPQIEDAMQLQNLTQRQRFYGYSPVRPNQNGIFGGTPEGYRRPSELFQELSAAGLPTSPMDAPTAANYAISMGMMPAQSSYDSFMKSAAMISTLAPGAGITGGVEAMGALGQARNVNMLRAIGINARNIGTNQVNSFESVINQLWSILTNANNGRRPSKEDLSNSLLPGNALDSLLDQYFDDPVLRQSAVAALFQRASGRGLSKVEMIATDEKGVGPDGLLSTRKGERGNTYGALASGILSEGDINTEYLKTYMDTTDPVISGLIGANKAGSRIMGFTRDMFLQGGTGNIIKPLLSTLSFVDAFSGLGQGAGGLALQGLMQGGSAIGSLGGALGPLGKFSGGAGAALTLLGLQALGGGQGFFGGVGNGNMAVPASYGGGGSGAGFQGPAIVNVSMPGATYTNGHAAGVAIANRMRRTTITRSTLRS